jgi:hypothetical protein
MNNIFMLALVAVASASEAPAISLDLDESMLSNAQLCMYEQEWAAFVGGDLGTHHFRPAITHLARPLTAADTFSQKHVRF